MRLFRFPGRWAHAAVMLGLAGLAGAVLWWRWVGYQGHDDAYYAWAAVDWAEHAPVLGQTHWALRYPLVLPTAALIRLFGFSVPALAAVDLTAYAAFLLMGYAAARRWFGNTAAAALTVIGVLLPQFPVQATYANPDLLEMALVVGSFWLVMLAREPGAQAGRLMLGAGVLAGLGFLARETTLLLVPLYGLMFVARPAMPRWRYLLIVAGFAAVVGAQMGWFAWAAGDPLYRLRISAAHDHVDRAAQAARATGALDGEGVLAAGLLWTPLAALFVSQKYGLLFWLALPAYPAARRAPWLHPQARSVLDWAAAGAMVSFLFVALNVGILYVVPRYFMVTAAMAAVPVAAAGAAGCLAAGFAASCLGLLYLENTEPMFAEQRAAAFIAEQPGTVYMDAETGWRTRALLIRPGLLDRVASGPPPPGALVAGKDGAAEACLRAPACPQRASAPAFQPGPAGRRLRATTRRAARWARGCAASARRGGCRPTSCAKSSSLAGRSWFTVRRRRDRADPARHAPREAAMINNLSILFSLATVVYVVVRASVLDAKQPWFPKAPPPETPPGDARRRARR